MFPEVFLNSRRCRINITELVVERLRLLTTLNFSDCNITNEGADIIASILLETVSLENLNLSSTNLNSSRTNVINDVLKNISSLKVFGIHNNNITDGATDSIAAVILSNSSLEKLNISHNRLSYTGILNIAKSLSAIKKLNISNNFIKSDNVEDLGASLAKCPALQELNISQNLLSLSNILMIAQFFRHHSALHTLNLSGNIDSFCSVCEFIVDLVLSVNQMLVNLNVCGRNIRPRYIENYLSSPTIEDNSTKLSLQNLYTFQHNSFNISDIQTNFIKVSETCPLSNKDVFSYYADYLGGVFYNQYHNFVIVIPPGAVSQGDCVEVQATANWFGPYIIPNGFYPISSYLWVSANYQFKAPVYLIMNHYAKIRSLDDVNNLHVLQTPAHDSNAVRVMSTISDGVYFDKEVRYCVLATNHFCSYCQAKSDMHIPEYLWACYCTYIDDSVSQSYIAEVCFCPSNCDCRKVAIGWLAS